MTLASSGMRIGETLQLKISDFDFTKDPIQVHIRGDYTKTGNSRLAFISNEATECVKEWLKVRAAWLNKYHVADAGRMFPFNKSAPLMFNRALSRTGLLEKDESTGRYTIHPHVLRKFFRTSLATEMPVDIIEALMGHEAYLTECYRKFTPDKLGKFYMKSEHLVTVFGESTPNEDVNAVVIENTKLRNKVEELTVTNEETRRRLNEVEDDISTLRNGNETLRGILSKEDFAELRQLVTSFYQKKIFDPTIGINGPLEEVASNS